MTYEEYQNIKNMIVNFGIYKGKTFNDIDEKYSIYIISSINKIDDSKILYYKVVDFFCEKFNFNLELE
jgi:hypothetical protein